MSIEESAQQAVAAAAGLDRALKSDFSVSRKHGVGAAASIARHVSQKAAKKASAEHALPNLPESARGMAGKKQRTAEAQLDFRSKWRFAIGVAKAWRRKHAQVSLHGLFECDLETRLRFMLLGAESELAIQS